MYIGPIDPYAGGAVFYGVSANVASHTLYTGGSARMHINSTGNVGIGTTSPAVQLELGDNTADEKLRLTGAASGKPLMTFYNTTTKIGQIAEICLFQTELGCL
jgi:hypothetical protein